MKTIIFAAIVGYTGVQTTDGRVLTAPGIDDYGRRPLNHRELPLPVTAAQGGEIHQVGKIEMAALCDGRIIVFGHLDPDERFDWVRNGLDRGGYYLEIDVDQVIYDHDADAVRLTTWRLAGAQIGINPCWKLPRTQIEIMNLKEKIVV